MQVKICGITHPEDASFAAKHGATLIGMIFSSQSKRVVSTKTAREICSSVKEYGAEPVAVFVDESLCTIINICQQTKIKIIQLHGKKSKEELLHLHNEYTIFYALTAGEDELYPLPLTKSIFPLFDSPKVEKAPIFDFENFIPPQRPWILAGGLNKDNVVAAIRLLQPYAVDVARGVELEGSIRKDTLRMVEFIQAAKGI